MKPVDIFGFSVEPSTDRKTPSTIGGRIESKPDIDHMIMKNVQTASFDNKVSVDFDFGKNRENDVRDLIMDIAFGSKERKLECAERLAQRLSLAMDGRSKTALFIAVRHEHGRNGYITLWTFPSDEAYRLSFPEGGVDLAVVRDIFSNTSSLRKAARFVGSNNPSEFMGGNVLDFQSMSSEADVAKLWIERFLLCKLSMSAEAGSRLLARSLKKLSVSIENTGLQGKLSAAAIAIQNSPIKEMTFNDIMNTFIPEELHSKYKTAVGEKNMLFQFKKDPAILRNFIGRNSFELESGVVVTTPIGEIDKSVQISIDGDKYLSCSGKVISEKLKGQKVA